MERLLDNIHLLAVGVEQATKRRRRFRVRREHLVMGGNILAGLSTVAATVFPQARPVAVAISALNTAAPNLIPKEEAGLCSRLQAVSHQIATAPEAERPGLLGQQQLLLEMIENEEKKR
jgi:hypothetical protein